MAMLTIVFFFIIICALCKFLWNRKNVGPPFVPDLIKLLWCLCTSSFKVIFKKLVEIGEFTSNNGGLSRISIWPLSIYFVTAPEDAAVVFTRCLEKSFIYDLIKPYVGSQLVSASVPVWKRNLRFTNMALKQNILDGYNVLFNKYSARLVDTLAENLNREMDFTKIITRSVLEIVSQTTMGIALENENLITDQYARAVDKELEIMINRVRYPLLYFDVFFNMSNAKKEQDEALKIIWNLSDKMIKLRKEEHYRRLKNKDFNDERKIKSYIEILIENTVSETDQILTDEELRNHVDNIMLAGFDTSSTVLLYILLCIGSYPHVQEEVFEELQRVVHPEGRPITRDDFSRLPYLDAVVKETLRLYPMGPLVARVATEDVQLEKYTIPAGSQIVIHVWTLNRNKLHWGPDTDEFKPERWLDSSTIPTINTAFATFAPGRRTCIGKPYVLAMLKIMLCHILQKYKVSADITKMELEFVILLKPLAGHTLKLELRK